ALGLLVLSSGLAAGHLFIEEKWFGPVWSPTREGEITPREAFRMHAEGRAFFVDAGGPESYSRGHVPGAIPLEPKDFDARSEEFLQSWPSGMAVIVTCRRFCGSGALLAKLLREAGLGDVYVLAGGVEAWELEGLPTER
ncbi:MAG TPA: rhodanese-like domain-containing protein, partial [Planctomycetota bacterium]|nr:rhodanese-like domain-containing protein [Planctomycetota bacterium]